VFKPRL